jgi:hypothetical protein
MVGTTSQKPVWVPHMHMKLSWPHMKLHAKSKKFVMT